ncbi:MAG TPA: helix-turn-helix domain-containing protein [Dehalococcoidia bacterium]
MESAHGAVEPFCPYFHHAVELIGRRWTGAILRALHAGVTRFTELTNTVPGLSDRMLSERLKELEAEGMIERRVIPETPVRVEYLLTEKGHALSGVMDAISAWATEWHDDAPDDVHACADERGAQAAGDRGRG